MKLKNLLFIFLCSFSSTFTQSQISNFKEKFELPNEVKETSGLLFLDGKIITHNDSGDNANLYEIDSLSGNLLRTISISNASNIDWEDITDDESHIYIGDMGNNNGNRTDLKIYKILKSDFRNNTSVSAEIISFSYQNQTTFSNSNNHNFDSEAIVVVDNSILIFTKNRGDFKTNVYKIPTAPGTHSAVKISSANVEGLITGASFSQDRFFLTGYNSTLTPFLIYISFNRMPGDDIFFSGFQKISLENELGQGSQVEAVTNIGFTGKFYISREFVSSNQGGMQFTFPQKLYEFYDETNPLLSIEESEFNKFIIYPNPIKDKIKYTSNLTIVKIEMYNSLGKKILVSRVNPQKEVDVSFLSSGVYYLKIQSAKNNSVIKKFIKL